MDTDCYFRGIMSRNSYKFINYKFSLKLSVLVLVLFTSVCRIASATSFVLDEETELLIFESVRLELVQNPSLKDPLDHLPLDVDLASMAITFASDVVEPTGIKIATFQLLIKYMTIEGDQGEMTCSAYIKELLGVRSTLKADCSLSAVLDSNHEILNEDDRFVVDEL